MSSLSPWEKSLRGEACCVLQWLKCRLVFCVGFRMRRVTGILRISHNRFGFAILGPPLHFCATELLFLINSSISGVVLLMGLISCCLGCCWCQVSRNELALPGCLATLRRGKVIYKEWRRTEREKRTLSAFVGLLASWCSAGTGGDLWRIPSRISVLLDWSSAFVAYIDQPSMVLTLVSKQYSAFRSPVEYPCHRGAVQGMLAPNWVFEHV